MNALWQLFLMRMRTYTRDPGALVWIFIFPMVTSLALGVAFRDQATPRPSIAVSRSAGNASGVSALEQTLRQTPGLDVKILDEADARRALRRGEVALLLLSTTPVTLAYDPARPESLPARLMTLRALEQGAGISRALPHQEETVVAQGSRYIDFLIPGMLGYNLMSSGIWGLGYALATMRKGKVLKRLAATPMNHSTFLGSFLLARLTVALAEVLFFVLFARILFHIRMVGSLLDFVAVGLLGALAFASLALLVGSRTQNTETAGGLANLVVLPMVMLSGVFFTVQHFPRAIQPFVALLPLTALNDSLRGIMNDGLALSALVAPLLVLAVWTVVPFVLALRLFRWT